VKSLCCDNINISLLEWLWHQSYCEWLWWRRNVVWSCCHNNTWLEPTQGNISRWYFTS